MPLYECPKCKSTDLVVIECLVMGVMPLSEDGYEVEGDTYKEKVRCQKCQHETDIEKFIKDE